MVEGYIANSKHLCLEHEQGLIFQCLIKIHPNTRAARSNDEIVEQGSLKKDKEPLSLISFSQLRGVNPDNLVFKADSEGRPIISTGPIQQSTINSQLQQSNQSPSPSKTTYSPPRPGYSSLEHRDRCSVPPELTQFSTTGPMRS